MEILTLFAIGCVIVNLSAQGTRLVGDDQSSSIPSKVREVATLDQVCISFDDHSDSHSITLKENQRVSKNIRDSRT
jgi:hypothetical protein